MKKPLTSWPTRVALNHPSPYENVDASALTFGATILWEDVMTLNCADEMIVTFVSGLVPPFRIVLTQGTYRQKGVVSRDSSDTPESRDYAPNL
jgi:hypothetical protein